LIKQQRKISLIGTATNLESGNTLIMAEHPDLVFLDVELGKQNWLEYYQAIRAKIHWPMKVILNTSYKKYIIDNRNPDCFDYLLKPYTNIDFARATKRFLKYKKLEEDLDNGQKDLVNPECAKTIITIDTIHGKDSYSLSSIKYFMYNNAKNEKRWYMVLISGKHIALKQKIYSVNIVEYSTSFLQINDSQIMNMQYISEIDRKKRCVFQKPNNKEDQIFNVTRAYFKQTRLHLKKMQAL
jgi:two-component system LytT family response regulator